MKSSAKLNDVTQIKTIQEMVLRSAAEYKNKIALEDLQETPIPRVTYSELLNNILRFGTALKKLDLRERTHIAVIGENRVQWAIAYLTCMTFNYVVVPIDKNLSQGEIFNVIHESDAEAVIFSAGFGDMFHESHSYLKRLRHDISMDDVGTDKDFISMKSLIDDSDPADINDLPKIDPNELAEIIFTSGSLGRAKGVMLSQGNLASNLVDMVSMLMIYPEDRFMSVLPIHHTYECTCGMLCPLSCGSSVHYARSLRTITEDLQKVKATMLLGVPLLFDKMYKKISQGIAEDRKKSILVPVLTGITDITSKLGARNLKKKIFAELHNKFGGAVRIFIAGGAAPDPLVAKGLRGLGFNFIQGYGLTETSPILTLNRIDNFKDHAAGLTLPSVEIKIDSPDKDNVGEIWVKGPNVMLGYYKNEDATKETFSDEWFKTGDLGYIDADGFLVIKGRKKNVIISRSGKNVFPEEIEDKLNRSPYILESVVCGVPDEKHDEKIIAKIVPDAEAFIEYSESKNINITPEMIRSTVGREIEKVNDELPIFKKVLDFEIREDEFEKTTTQKIKRHLVSKE